MHTSYSAQLVSIASTKLTSIPISVAVYSRAPKMHGLILKVAVVTLLLTVGQSSAALQIGTAATHPQHPDSCWFEDKKLAVKANQELVPPGFCEKIRCSKNSDGILSYTFEQCGSFAPPPGCRVERDPALGYPACCANLVCDKTP